MAQTDEVMRRVIREFTGGRVDLAYEHVVEFDYHKCPDGTDCSITPEEWTAIHERFSEPQYLWTIEPMADARESLERLGQAFDIHFATTRRPKARRTTIERLEAHRFPAHDLHFLKHGEKHASLGRFFAAVEDHYEQAIDFAGAGTPCYLIAHPWNRSEPPIANISWSPGWQDLSETLLGKI